MSPGLVTACRLLLFCGILAAFPAARRGGAEQAQEPLPNFSGTIRGIDSKVIALEVPGPNLLEFRCSKKTKYYDGSKKIASSTLKPGDHVTVEARRALDGSLDAVNVRLERQKPAQ